MKKCSICQEVKPFTDFYKASRPKDGCQSMCKVCSHARRKQYHVENKDKENTKTRLWAQANKDKVREHTLKKYGISSNEYNQMREHQQFSCLICGEKETSPTSLHVDHCHKDGHVRGLLCFHCNSMLGKAKDSISILESAIQYLKKEKEIAKKYAN